MGKIIIFKFADQSKIVKYLAILKNSFVKLKKILLLIISNKLNSSLHYCN